MEAIMSPLCLRPHELRAALGGRLGEVRRVVKPQPTANTTLVEWNFVEHAFVPWSWFDNGGSRTGKPIRCPLGAVGDRIWCREGYRETWDIGDRLVLEYRAGGTRLIHFDDRGQKIAEHGEHQITSVLPRWRSPVTMPRWASRLSFEITSVRVERVQAITEQGALACGVDTTFLPLATVDGCRVYHADRYPTGSVSGTAIDAYRVQFDTDNGPGAWDANGFVWCVGVRRTET